MRNVKSTAEIAASSVDVPPVRLELFGAPKLLKGSTISRLERRTAAVLAYLALEGEAVKYQLAGWLWAESPETTARNNMRQLLRRLKQSAAVDVIEGEDRIRLTEHVVADAQEMQAHAFAGDHAKALEFSSELLQGMLFDDSPDFEEWLLAARESLEALRRSAAVGESARLEGLGELSAALRFAAEHLRLEPLSEDAHRRIMRLHYLTGDRSTALQTFDRCERLLKTELGVEPLPETVALMREIERGATLPQTAPPSRDVPLSVLRPPALVGRDSEWALMETAWTAGRFIAIEGEPGTGKTRLMMDFLTSKLPRESILYLQARPGDAAIAYSSHARNYRQMLEQFRPDLEPWVRRELARMLPELGETPEPIRSEDDKLRFYQAKLETMVACIGKGLRALASDDVQFVDAASGEASLFMMGGIGATGARLAAVYAFRCGELDPQNEAVIQGGVEAGLITRLQLEALPSSAVSQLLASLNLREAGDLAAPLQRYTGGNPMFVLETVKHLFETGQLERGWPGRLPPPGKVGAVVQRRLERLSANALHLAQAAAVLKRDFTVELVAGVVGLSPFEALAFWSELEAAQVMTGERFTHDLVFETIAANTPETVRRWLHRRAAETLEAASVDGVRIAEHWLEGGDGQKAVPHLIRSANALRELGLPAQAKATLERALAQVSPRSTAGMEIRLGIAELHPSLGTVEQAVPDLEALLLEVEDPRNRVRALDALHSALALQGKLEGALKVIDEGLEVAERLEDEQLIQSMHYSKGSVYYQLGRIQEAAQHLEPLEVVFRRGPFNHDRLQLTTALGLIREATGRAEEGRALHQEVYDGAKLIGSTVFQVQAASNLLFSHNNADTTEQALPLAEEALSLGQYAITEYLRINLAVAYRKLGRLEEAAAHYLHLIAHATNPNIICLSHARLVMIRSEQGQPQEAQVALSNSLEWLERADIPNVKMAVLLAALEHGSAAQIEVAERACAGIDVNALPSAVQKQLERVREFKRGIRGTFINQDA
jgi:DNA-binding SARP family transcriptional activator/tetratricopeptide (TPR) repeat protein